MKAPRWPVGWRGFLHRYAAAFEFRYNYRAANGVNDLERASVALSGVVGKRILYQDSLGA